MTLRDIPETLKSVEHLENIKKARQEAEAYIKAVLEDKNDESKG